MSSNRTGPNFSERQSVSSRPAIQASISLQAAQSSSQGQPPAQRFLNDQVSRPEVSLTVRQIQQLGGCCEHLRRQLRHPLRDRSWLRVGPVRGARVLERKTLHYIGGREQWRSRAAMKSTCLLNRQITVCWSLGYEAKLCHSSMMSVAFTMFRFLAH